MTENGLVQTQISKQVNIKNQFEGTMAKINQQIKVDTSEAESSINITYAYAQAEATRILNEQVAAIKNISIVSKANSYQQVNTILDISPNDYLQQYIYYTNLLKNENSTVLVGVDKAMVNMISHKYGYWCSEIMLISF